MCDFEPNTQCDVARDVPDPELRKMASLIVSGGLAEAQERRYWNELIRAIEKVAAGIASKYLPPERRGEFVKDSRSHICVALRRWNAAVPGRFLGWVCTILANKAKDELRRLKKDPLFRSYDCSSDKALLQMAYNSYYRMWKSCRIARAGLLEFCEEVRPVLDRIRWDRAPKGRVDSFSLLLLECRLAPAGRIARAFDRDGTVSWALDEFESNLPLRAEEWRRTIVADGPPLLSVWQDLRASIIEQSEPASAATICRAISKGLDAPIEPAYLAQLKKRALEKAYRHAGPKGWPVLERLLGVDKRADARRERRPA